jgi:hypothetical protein
VNRHFDPPEAFVSELAGLLPPVDLAPHGRSRAANALTLVNLHVAPVRSHVAVRPYEGVGTGHHRKIEQAMRETTTAARKKERRLARGVDLGGGQETKTGKALEFFSDRLKAAAEGQPAG